MAFYFGFMLFGFDMFLGGQLTAYRAWDAFSLTCFVLCAFCGLLLMAAGGGRWGLEDASEQ